MRANTAIGGIFAVAIALAASSAVAQLVVVKKQPDSNPFIHAPPSAPHHRLDLPIEGVAAAHWTEMPTADQMAEFYPKLAWALQLGGRAQLSCQQTPIGTLDHCSAVSERPAGLGFGDAAVLLTPYFHTKPDAASGDDVNFTVLFRMPPADPAAVADTPARQPTKRALELARQLVDALRNNNPDDQPAKMCGDSLRIKVESDSGVTALTPQAEAAIDAFGQACEAALPTLSDKAAETYADLYSESELVAILAFVQSPPGKAWISRSKEMALAEQHSEATIWKSVFDDAHVRLCQKIAC